MPALEVKGVCKSFASRPILDRVSLRVERGQALALLGPSGCGKTTLLRIIAGLERLDEGEVWIGDACVSARRNHVPPERRELGMMFQDLALWPHMRAWRHLEFVLRGRGQRRPNRIESARAALSLFGLDHRAEAYPAAMSGGEQQRLALARALITNPPLLLLDEPFANLNQELRGLIVQELERRMDKRGVSIIIATHDPEEVERFAATRVRLAGTASPEK